MSSTHHHAHQKGFGVFSIVGIVAVVLVLGGIVYVNQTRQSVLSEGATTEAGMMQKNTSPDNTMMQNGEMEAVVMETIEGERTPKEVQVMDHDAMVMQKDAATMDSVGDGAMMMKAGTYEAYAPEKLVKADAGDVVLFFRASWCPMCHAVHTDIQAHVEDIPSTLTILDVDYDDSTALKQKYGVTYQHTFVQVDAQGILIKKWSGSPTLSAVVTEVIS